MLISFVFLRYCFYFSNLFPSYVLHMEIKYAVVSLRNLSSRYAKQLECLTSLIRLFLFLFIRILITEDVLFFYMQCGIPGSAWCWTLSLSFTVDKCNWQLNTVRYTVTTLVFTMPWDLNYLFPFFYILTISYLNWNLFRVLDSLFLFYPEMMSLFLCFQLSLYTWILIFPVILECGVQVLCIN